MVDATSLGSFRGTPTPEGHRGINYVVYLGHLARATGARAYLEIGTSAGASLQQVPCPAVCVDPVFGFEGNPAGGRPVTLLYQMTSDEYFTKFDPRDALQTEIELAFLDGQHLFEYLLRDFMNTEAVCRQDSSILLHDCLPLNSRMAERNLVAGQSPEDEATWSWWTGDVWKILFILRKYRPDLEVLLLDCPPSGLVMITGLDPSSRVLHSAYSQILNEFMNLTLDAARKLALFSTYPTVNTGGFDRERVALLLETWRQGRGPKPSS